jgi:hypothetical protein
MGPSGGVATARRAGYVLHRRAAFFFGGQHARQKTGFVLLVFPFQGEGRCNYISNGADRRDIVVLMKEQIRRFEGQPEMEGHA